MVVTNAAISSPREVLAMAAVPHVFSRNRLVIMSGQLVFNIFSKFLFNRKSFLGVQQNMLTLTLFIAETNKVTHYKVQVTLQSRMGTIFTTALSVNICAFCFSALCIILTVNRDYFLKLH
jgi:hypothetical protein